MRDQNPLQSAWLGNPGPVKFSLASLLLPFRCSSADLLSRQQILFKAFPYQLKTDVDDVCPFKPGAEILARREHQLLLMRFASGSFMQHFLRQVFDALMRLLREVAKGDLRSLTRPCQSFLRLEAIYVPVETHTSHRQFMSLIFMLRYVRLPASLLVRS